MRIQLPLLLAILLLAACGDPEPVDQGPPETSTTEIGDDDKADEFGDVRVRAADMTIWANPVVQTTIFDWLLEARASYNLASISASVGGEEVEANLVSERKFEVNLEASALVATLEETPLLVELTTTSGLERTVMFTTRARFGYSSGSSKIYPWKNLSPVMVEGEAMFRGRLTVDEEFQQVWGSNDDDSEPFMRQEDETHWIADFHPFALAWAGHPVEDPIVFIIEDDQGNRFSRDVHIVTELKSIGITSDDPASAWPAPTCEADVLSCVETLGQWADLESCGSVAEVRPCIEELPEDNTPELKSAFADGLRDALFDFYAENGDDVVASGGNRRGEALLMVDTASMEEVLDEEDNPSGYDLVDHRVFSHPDFVFPGSDRVWYGVFDRSDDSLVDVFDFN